MTTNLHLTSQRLLLRPVQASDAPALFAYRSDAETNQYQGWIPQTLDETTDFIRNRVSPTINQPDTWFQLVIVEQSSNRIIGDVGIHFMDEESRQVEIGCTLRKDCHGNGYATEALKVIITYLFEELTKHRVVTSIDPQNLASIALVERLGFRKEAHFRESICINGQWVDDLVYAVLKREWSPTKMVSK